MMYYRLVVLRESALQVTEVQLEASGPGRHAQVARGFRKRRVGSGRRPAAEQTDAYLRDVTL